MQFGCRLLISLIEISSHLFIFLLAFLCLFEFFLNALQFALFRPLILFFLFDSFLLLLFLQQKVSILLFNILFQPLIRLDLRLNLSKLSLIRLHTD